MVVLVFDAGLKGFTKLYPLLYLRNRLCWHGLLVALQIFYKRKLVKVSRRDDVHILNMLEKLPVTPLLVSTDRSITIDARARGLPAFYVPPDPSHVCLRAKSRILRRKIFTGKVLEKLIVWTRKTVKRLEIPITDCETVVKIVESCCEPPVQYINIVPTSRLVYTLDVDRRVVYENEVVDIVCHDKPTIVTVCARRRKCRNILQSCRLVVRRRVLTIGDLLEKFKIAR